MREEAASAPLVDVPLGLHVRLGRCGAHDVDPELLGEPLEFRGCHAGIVPVVATVGSFPSGRVKTKQAKDAGRPHTGWYGAD